MGFNEKAKVDEYGIPKCKICREYLARCLVEPLRCPGLGCENGRYYVGRKGTDSFKWWDEIRKEVDERNEIERLRYWEGHKEHLVGHGIGRN